VTQIDDGSTHVACRLEGEKIRLTQVLSVELFQTTLVQPHRLRALILEDLERFPDSGRADIHRRIGPEIHEKAVARALEALLSEQAIVAAGERRWRTYRLADAKGHES